MAIIAASHSAYDARSANSLASSLEAPADADLGIRVEVASVVASIPSGLPAFVETVPGAAAQKQFFATANSNRAGMPARLNFFLCR